MASQDETPTHRSTAGGEPLNGTEASVPPQGSAPNGSGSHAATAPEPAGTSEHADWDAEFDNLTASQRADADAEAAADEAGDAPVDAEEPDVEEPDVEDVERTPEAPEQLEDPKDPEGPEDVEDADLGNREAAESPAASGNRDAAGTAGTGGTVPGGHPKVAQRSQLPMRRASTLPDLSGYSSTDDDDDTDDAVDAGPEDRDRAGGETAAASAETSSGAVEAGEGLPHAAPSGAHEAGRHEADGSGDSETDSITDSETTPEREPETSDAVDGEVQDGTAAETTESTKTAVTPVIAHSAETESGTEPAIDRADHADDVDPALAEAQRRAQEREKAAAGKPVLARVLQVMIAVFFPVMVLAAAIRAVATPLFLWAEYHRPGFPADSYGFSTDDRMTYGSYAVDYLLNFSGSRYLGDLVGDGGEPLYLASEVSHMADVKTVLTVAFIAATVMAVLSLFAALYLRRRSPGGIRRSLFSGAVVTLVLVAALVVLAVLGWEQFFTQLHTVFFANGNWTFRLDDTLIRLFPAQFWMDAGITIAALVLLTCVVVLVCCWPTRARRERVQQAREDARRRYAESLEAL
ncbi:TIGR01906 family membrane protein [Arthrobacter sp. zg-Y1110]|uniref:TIGR01906 family membrane protein n=1 Tax=Arthrobacter sp. zg-Y1110 TaxID=2886932 RepID=UPI0027DEFC68|nr:TIGR01906 family membrane protein [Arthrobacter sp. zg-Y1110]